jgi:hypothetical protein
MKKILNILLMISLILNLTACVEGRTGKSLSGTDSKNLSPGSDIGTAQEILELEYVRSKFSESLNSLSILFGESFIKPFEITENASCDEVITSTNFNKYNSYLSELKKVSKKYIDAIKRIRAKVYEEKNVANRLIYEEVLSILESENEQVGINTEDCEKALDAYDSSSGN